MRLTLRIDFDGRQIGPGKIRLLELVDTHGSITASGKMMDMSYRRAWLLIDELNRMFEQPLVETRPGGRGGNARLSVLGRAVVHLYRSIKNDCYSASNMRLRELQRHLKGASTTETANIASTKSPKKGCKALMNEAASRSQQRSEVHPYSCIDFFDVTRVFGKSAFEAIA